jgi:outer membrane protein
MTKHAYLCTLSAALMLLITTQNNACAENLSDIYALALEHDPVLKQSAARQAASLESRAQGLARFFPTISVTASSSRDRLNSKKNTFQGAGVQNYWNNTVNANLKQPVFHWDHWIQLSQSDNQIAQAEANYKAEEQNLIVKISEAYFNVLGAQDNLEFTTAEKNAIARQLDQANQRFEVGIIAITDVHEAQAAHDLALANEIEAENNLDNKKEALKEIIGEYEPQLDRLRDELNLSSPEPKDIESWKETARENNLRIIAALNQAEYARKTIDVQNSGHMPQVDIIGSYGVSDNQATFGLRGDTQSIGLQVNVPLFEGGMVMSRARQARQEYEEAKEKLIEAQRAVTREVKDAYRGVVSNISRVDALKASVVSAESALEATEAGFEVGTRTMVDVLAEQRSLYRAKRDYARSRYDYFINSIKLKSASSNLTQADLEAIDTVLVKSSN